MIHWSQWIWFRVIHVTFKMKLRTLKVSLGPPYKVAQGLGPLWKNTNGSPWYYHFYENIPFHLSCSCFFYLNTNISNGLLHLSWGSIHSHPGEHSDIIQQTSSKHKKMRKIVLHCLMCLKDGYCGLLHVPAPSPSLTMQVSLSGWWASACLASPSWEWCKENSAFILALVSPAIWYQRCKYFQLRGKRWLKPQQ